MGDHLADSTAHAKRFWTIIFPLISPTTFFLIVVNLVYAFFETFAIHPNAVTGGAPTRATEILVDKVFQGRRRLRPRRLVGTVGDPEGCS